VGSKAKKEGHQCHDSTRVAKTIPFMKLHRVFSSFWSVKAFSLSFQFRRSHNRDSVKLIMLFIWSPIKRQGIKLRENGYSYRCASISIGGGGVPPVISKSVYKDHYQYVIRAFSK